MRAIILREAGSPDNLEMTELPKPVLNDREVLIQSKAISINPVDAKVRIGKSLYNELRSQNPFIIPGWDVSGIITQTGKSVTEFKAGDEVYFHITNLEQDWDVPHGFAMKGANNAELLIMPGETQTLKWIADKPGMYPFYCTDFCSALHQEMSGYLRVSPAGSNVALLFSTGKNLPPADSTVASKL